MKARDGQSSWSPPDRHGAIWMVVRDGLAGPVTYGPFDTEDEADAFANSPHGGFVYDDRANRSSACGPWLP